MGPLGREGPVRTRPSLIDHVERCVTRARAVGIQLLAPTFTLDAAVGQGAERALDMAEHALRLDHEVGITIAGTAAFWTAGPALDAYMGAIASFRPLLVNIVVVRGELKYPEPAVSALEVEAVCRSVHSLSMRSEVIAGWGDLAALPAVVAGAGLVGTGWDLRHRLCSLDSFRPASTGGRASWRVMHNGLLASLKRPEAEALRAADPTASARLVPGALPVDQNAHWRYHLECMTAIVDRIIAAGDRERRYRFLERAYRQASRDLTAVEGVVDLEAGTAQWIEPLAMGLDQYATAEGW